MQRARIHYMYIYVGTYIRALYVFRSIIVLVYTGGPTKHNNNNNNTVQAFERFSANGKRFNFTKNVFVIKVFVRPHVFCAPATFCASENFRPTPRARYYTYGVSGDSIYSGALQLIPRLTVASEGNNSRACTAVHVFCIIS